MTLTKKQDNKEIFISWLSKKISSEQLSRVLALYEIIDDFCIKTKISNQPLLQTTDIHTVKLVYRTVEQNRIFRFRYKNEINRILSAMRYYVTYIKEVSIIDKETQFAMVIDNSVVATEKSYDTKKCESIMTISFDKIIDLSYTKPVFVSYFNEEIKNISTWKQLYVSVFEKLYKDYDKIIPLNQSFNSGKGRMDFCNTEYYSSMVSPKEIVFGKFLETNLSATDIVRKIKLLLDICLVDTENILIKYEPKVDSNKNTEKHKEQVDIKSTISKEDFFQWLNHDQGMATPTCHSYVSAINVAEKYAADNKFTHCKLYVADYKEVKATFDELFNNKVFLELNEQQHNRFRAGINKLLLYIESTDTTQKKSVELEPFIDILTEKFPKGYRIASPIELRKFKRYWENHYGNILDISDDIIIKTIESCGIVHQEKLYVPKNMLDDEASNKLFSYITKSFQSGKTVIYFEALFNEFSDVFLDYCMYDASMLRSYLKYMNNGNFYISKNFISKDDSVSVEPYDEIKACLIQQASPMEYTEIFKKLSHIPEQKIKNILASYEEFISNGRCEYFHISITSLNDDEIENIARIIEFSINEKNFISGNELVDDIKKKFPYIIEQNALLSNKGLRDAIGYRLKERFSFKGNIISSKGESLSMMKVFEDFSKQKDSFTLNELKILKQELGTIIYFDAIYENSLRINRNEFLSKTQVSFNIKEIDTTIERFCTGDYIAIGKFEQFGSFPDVGFEWNSFLLESYVAMYSADYKLVHSNFNENVCVGGIVKKTSNITTLDELVIDVLAKNKLPLLKETALQYLYDEGYIARRSYSGIEQLLIKAKELRNQKGL